MTEGMYGSKDAVWPQASVGNPVRVSGVKRAGKSQGPHVRFSVRDPYPLENLAQEIHGTAAAKGFWTKPEMMDKYAAKLALVHSEVTEILEALRKDQGPEAVTEEFCDVIIRLLDLFDVLAETGLAEPGIDEILREKIAKNEARPAKHGHKWG